MRATAYGITSPQRYDMLLADARQEKLVNGPLGVPGWKPASKKTVKDLVEMGKLKKASPKGKTKTKILATATVKRVNTAPAIPAGLSPEDLALIAQRNAAKGAVTPIR